METRVTTRGRIVIPASVRRTLGIKAGVHIYLEIDAQTGRIFLTPVTREYIHSLRGKYKGRGLLNNREASGFTRWPLCLATHLTQRHCERLLRSNLSVGQ